MLHGEIRSRIYADIGVRITLGSKENGVNEDDARIDELQKTSEIHANRLGVAEDLGWIIGLLSAVIVHEKWGGWLIPAATIFVVFYFVTLLYSKKDDDARDAYHRAAGIAEYRVRSDEP